MIQVRTFDAFGTGYEILADTPVDGRWLDKLLPGIGPGTSEVSERDSLAIVTRGAPEARGLFYKGERLCGFRGFDEETARGFEGNIQFVMARNAAPDYLFIHAGAVSIQGAGIIFPSKTGSGKTTLTRALLEIGAEYFSDDCAVTDCSGMLYPMPTPMKLREEDGRRAWLHPSDAGFSSSLNPVKIGCVLLTRFEKDSMFRPSKISPGEASMGILENLFLPSLMRDCPKETLAAVNSIVDSAILLEGPRGDADEAAKMLRSLIK